MTAFAVAAGGVLALAPSAVSAGSTGGTTVAAPAAPAAAVADAPVAAAAPARTSKAEAKRVDRIKFKLKWKSCYSGKAQCATASLPLDYDKPKGAKTKVALLRVKATKKSARIGSLFVNPGGPGGSGRDLAAASIPTADSPSWLSAKVRQRFDIVGVDPRGIAGSSNAKCFSTTAKQEAALAGLYAVYFPYTKAEEKAAVSSAKKLGKACSTTGKKLAGSMSTAEVARDMDVLRRAVGDKKLTYLGFSYGTFLGEVYANLFPDRVRAITIDGVLNPISWVGTAKTGKLNQDERLHSADGATKALNELLRRCGEAGPAKCSFAAYGDPVLNYATIAERLKANKYVDPADGSEFGYADLVGTTLTLLYIPEGPAVIDSLASALWELTTPAVAGQRRAAAQERLTRAVRTARAVSGRAYDNSYDAFSAVICTDARHPADAATWPAQGAKADQRAPYFGRAWAWSTPQCASKTWTVRDEDAYKGPFTRRTAPVLVVGNYYDPATNYEEAVSTAALMPGSRLLSSDSWGHTAYGSSSCVTGAVDNYLVSKKLPKAGTTCVGDVQPFTTDLTGPLGAASKRAPRPPVAVPPVLQP